MKYCNDSERDSKIFIRPGGVVHGAVEGVVVAAAVGVVAVLRFRLLALGLLRLALRQGRPVGIQLLARRVL